MSEIHVQGPELWTPDEHYYQEIADLQVNAPFHAVARAAVMMGRLIRFGVQEIVTAPEFDSMNISSGNVIVSAVHRDALDTVLLPSVLERVGIHHSRPVSKIELFQARGIKGHVSRAGLHRLGAFAVDRKNPNVVGLDLVHKAVLSRGGNITNYAEGTRVHRDVTRVAKIKAGVVRAAILNGSIVVPVGFAGLSTEKDEYRKPIARDERKWLSVSPKLVFAFGGPIRIDPTSIPVDTPRESLSSKDGRQLIAEIKERNEYIRESMQKALDLAYKVRGSSLEEDLTNHAA